MTTCRMSSYGGDQTSSICLTAQDLPQCQGSAMSYLHALPKQLNVASGILYWHDQVCSTRQSTILRHETSSGCYDVGRITLLAQKGEIVQRWYWLCECNTILAILDDSAGPVSLMIVFRSLFFTQYRPQESNVLPPIQDPAYQCTLVTDSLKGPLSCGNCLPLLPILFCFGLVHCCICCFIARLGAFAGALG
jgi:hypothetical protein